MRGAGGDSPGGEYERYRAAVLGMLAKRFPRLDQDERLAIYHDAWTRVLVKRESGGEIRSLRAYLLATAGAEALHVLSRGRIPTPVGPDDPRLAALPDDAPPLDEQVVTRDQARIGRSLLDSLDERQRDVLKLRWDLQLTGSEVRSALGLTERQYRRLAEEGAAALAARVEERESGQWSRRTRSLLVACLVEVTCDGERRVGIASARQREEAQRLLRSDPHVAALYAEVRRSVRGAPGLLPHPVFVLGSGNQSLPSRLGELAYAARDQLTSAIGTAKQHAMSVYIRVTDPTLLTTGPRPGTAVVAIAGALAVGGGTYNAHKTLSSPSARPAPTVATEAVLSTSPAGRPSAARPPRRPTKPVRPPQLKAPPPIQRPLQVPTPPTQPTSTPIPPPPPSQLRDFGFED